MLLGRWRSARVARAALGGALCRIAALLVAAGAAAGAAPLTLAEAERLALCAEPGVVALQEEAAAFDELAVAAGAWPDPQVRIGAANLPIEGGGFRTEGMTQAQLGLRQAFPASGSRAAAAQRDRTRAEQRQAEARERARNVLLGTRNAWLARFLASRSRQLVLDARPLFADLVAITRSLYTVGDANQQDLLRAELESSQLQARLVAIEQQDAEARAALRRWIDAAADRPLAALSTWRPPPSLDELTAQVAEHPLLAAADASAAVADAAVALARAGYRPHWTLDAAYGYRDGGLPDGSSRPDFLSVSATLSVPLFAANRQDRALRAAESRRRAALARRDDAWRNLQAELLREHGRWVDVGRRLQVYRDAVLGQSGANAEAALAAYRSETGDFAEVMRGYINDLEVQLAHLALRVDRRRSHARLAYLGGFELTDGGHSANASGAEACTPP